MLTPGEIKYIREWTENGNEPRIGTDIKLRMPVPIGVLSMCNDMYRDIPLFTLGAAGIEIARQAIENRKLRDALEQANDTAELLWIEECPADYVDTMRANRKELLG